MIIEEGRNDAMYRKAMALLYERGSVGISDLQRALSIGYTRASRLLEAMKQDGLGVMDGLRLTRASGEPTGGEL